MAEDRIAPGETSAEEQERLRQEQEDARTRRDAERRDAENEQIEGDAGRAYEQAVVMGDVVEPSIVPPTPRDPADDVAER